jgi:hypothetical protein
MKKVISQRFNEQNAADLAKFEKKLHDETKYLGVLIQNQFEEEFLALKTGFHKELKDKNYQTFNELTKQFVEHIYED